MVDMEVETVDDVVSLSNSISVMEPFTHLIEVKRDSRDARTRFIYDKTNASDLIALFEASGTDQVPELSGQQVPAGSSQPASPQDNVLVMRLALIGANVPEKSHGQTVATNNGGLVPNWDVYVRILRCMGLVRSVPADAVKHATFPPKVSSIPGEHYLTKCLRYRLTVHNYDIVWAFDAKGAVYGLLRFWDPQATRRASAAVRDLWYHKDWAGHPMLLSTLSLFHIVPGIRMWLDTHISGVIMAMRETGFHHNTDIRAQTPLDAQELGRHSAVLSGHACNLATNKHCWEGLQSLADTVIEECRRTKKASAVKSGHGRMASSPGLHHLPRVLCCSTVCRHDSRGGFVATEGSHPDPGILQPHRPT